MEEKKVDEKKLEDVTGGFSNEPDDGKYAGILHQGRQRYELEKKKQEMEKK